MKTTTTGPITLADVKSALGDTNPGTTNAGAIRQIIGRGSFATIQKHLDAIRAARAPVMSAAPGAIPAPPADAIATIWGAAWAHAQLLTLARLEAVTAERDAAQALAAAQAQDVEALAAEVDTLTAAAEAQATEQTQALAAAQATAAEAIAQSGNQAQELVAARAEIDRVTTAAAAAALLADREAEIKVQALQAAIDRQLERYADLKSVVSHFEPKPKKA